MTNWPYIDLAAYLNYNLRKKLTNCTKKGVLETMHVKTLSSDQARTQWREMLDTVVSGENVIIERYGKPVAAIISYQDFADRYQTADVIREETAVYQTNEWAAIKADLIAEIKANLLNAKQQSAEDWLLGWQTLHAQVAETGGLMVGLNQEEIVSKLKQTRQEIFEAEYAHLY